MRASIIDRPVSVDEVQFPIAVSESAISTTMVTADPNW